MTRYHQKKSGSAPKKKKTKGPRVALRLPREPQALWLRCTSIWTGIKADSARYATPYPPASQVEPELKVLHLALQAVEDGEPGAATALEVAADKVRRTFGMLGKYVESIVRAGPAEDAPALFDAVQMYESNLGKRAPKPELEAQHGETSGLTLLIALAVASAVAYFWEWSLDQLSWVTAAHTGQAHASIAGLTPGKTYYFRFRALRRDGTMTDPSQVVAFMVK